MTQPTQHSSASIEWPTVGLAFVIHTGLVAVTWWWEALPLPIVIAVGGWLVAWHGSLQHEVIHGHPTPNERFNDLIGSIPFSLWLPYQVYPEAHLTHHRNEYLTDPIEDPESSYFTRATWERLGRFGQRLAGWNMTLFGRLTIGPAVMILSFLAQETLLTWRGEPGRAKLWAVHLAGVVVVLFWVVVVCGMPLWLYLLGFVYLGAAITRLRSYAEHRYAADYEERTAIVENSRLFGLLFLFNNLHVLHHQRPGLPWYRLPATYRKERDALIELNGGLVYNGYGDVIRRFFLRYHDDPRHPDHA